MSDELIENNADLPVNAEVRELVDKFIDGRLSDSENKRLEEILEADGVALAYCAERMRLHAEMEAVLSPVRVELTQKRRMVFETKQGESTVSRAVSHVVKVENPKFGKSMELPPSMAKSKRVRGLGIAAILLIVCALAVMLKPRVPETQLAFRNGSFEDLKINQNGAPFIYTILDWQDYFQTNKVRVCDMQRATEGARSAQDGEYAVLMQGGFLTQRLANTDGSAFVARPGLKLKVSGWAMLDEAGTSTTFSISSRVVVSAYPSMAQVEPDEQNIKVTKNSWQYFEVVLSLPEGDLMMQPNIFRPSALEKAPSIIDEVDINGLDLAISIDNKSKVPMYLDNLKIEELSQEP